MLERLSYCTVRVGVHEQAPSSPLFQENFLNKPTDRELITALGSYPICRELYEKAVQAVTAGEVDYTTGHVLINNSTLR